MQFELPIGADLERTQADLLRLDAPHGLVVREAERGLGDDGDMELPALPPDDGGRAGSWDRRHGVTREARLGHDRLQYHTARTPGEPLSMQARAPRRRVLEWTA